ncbi:MAG TPA: hypothetical protein VFT32_05435 [Candidatus Eisenbacteria bacterium]|nr:hypothetical protein [Candidatus Eisenbacteria bacterium]
MKSAFGAPALAALLAGAIAAVGCGSDRFATADAAAAESVATSLRDALAENYRPQPTFAYGRFADPASGDSLGGYVVRVSAPFGMVDRDTIPHEWLRERLRGAGWALEAEADGPDGASYRAVRGRLRAVVAATWEDLHEPADEADWYALTVALPASSPTRMP